MSIASEITRINNNIANAYTQISNKGGTLPQNQNSLNLANAITSITSGLSGLEYETGTYEPEEDDFKPTISFTNTHTTLPSLVIISETSNIYDETTNSNYMFTYIDYNLFVGSELYEKSDGSLVDYGFVLALYRATGLESLITYYKTLTHGATESSSSDPEYPRYWVSETGFTPSSNSRNRLWRSGKTFEWIAVWR